MQALRGQPTGVISREPASISPVTAGWPATAAKAARWLVRPGDGTTAATIRLITFSLFYTSLLGVLEFWAPRGTNFDFFYLAGCAFAGWAGGARAAMLVVLTSTIILQFHQTRVGAGTADWMGDINSAVRLLAYTATAWLAGEAGKLTRNLERKVQERTDRLSKEVAEHKATSEFLNEAIQLFRQVTENIADVFWVTDSTKTEVEYISPGFERIWGRSCTDLYASPACWLEGIHPEDGQHVALAMATKQIRGDYDEEYRVVRPDGGLRWVHDRAFAVKDEQGAVYRIVGIAEDITERKRAEQLLQAERDLGAALSSTSDLKFAVERLLDIAMELEGIDCGGVYLMDQQTGELHLEAHRGLSGSFVEHIEHFKADETDARLARAGQITYVRHEQIPRNLRALWGSQGLRALAVVPLRHKGVVLGMLNLASYKEDEIAPRMRLGIELIASQVAAAFARIAAEQSLRRSEARLRAIVNDAPVALLAVDGDGRFVFEDGQALSAMGIKPGEHLGRSAVEVFGDFPLMQNNVQRAMRAESFGAIVSFGDNVFDCRFSAARHQVEGVNGFIAVATDITERFRLERQILEISDREQARMGQDVHDGLCQQLVGAAFVANSLRQVLVSEERPEAGQAQRIYSLLDEAITESRRVARGLYPVRLETEGLGPALQELASVMTEKFGITCGCQVTGDALPCGTTAATHLYRIAQEAMNNAIKHSKARNISVSLAGSARGIDLQVKDDGKGFQNTVTPRMGMGLYIMEYRARSLGASFRLDSGSAGTVVRCHLPRNQQSA